MYLSGKAPIGRKMDSPSPDDAQWLGQVVERYQGPLISMASRITGDLDRAREVAQDSFLKLGRQERSKVEKRVGSWLFTVCRNRALDVVKKDRRMQPVEDLGCWTPDPRQETPAESCSREDLLDWVQGFVAELKPRDQEVVRLKFEQGMSYREIGEVMGLSSGNVGFILHSALQRIRKRLSARERARPILEHDNRSRRSTLDRIHTE